MQSNNSSENKSFETIELLPIEELFTGIQSPFDIDTSPISGATEPKNSIPQDKSIQKIDISSTADPVASYSNVAENTDTFDDFSNPINNPSNTPVNNPTNNPNTPPPSSTPINPDFNRFFRDGWRRQQQEADRKKKNQTLFGVVCMYMAIILIALVVFSRFMVSSSKDENRISVDYSAEDGYNKSMIPVDMYMSVNSAFQIVNMENIEYSYRTVDIDPMVIIYNGPDKRVLFFRIKPYGDNVVPRIYVTAYDNDGNILAENTQSMTGVGDGSEGMLPIALNIASGETDIRYYVRCNCGTIVTPDSQRKISGVREEDNHLLVSLYGKNNMYKDVYAVFYKEGKLVEILTARSKSAYGLEDYTTVDVDFDLGQIDWDRYDIYL